MSRRFQLEHLLYTSRISFETIACSPGIDRQVRVQLERWASDYPVKRGEGSGAPLVIRGFPLEREDRAWGIALLCYTGGDLSRPEGNYLAHAFVVPGAAFRELGSNAAWIAAHLPFWSTYQSPPGAARAEIQPVEIEIDRARQLRFARLLLAEQGKERCSALLVRALQKLDAANDKSGALALPFGPVPESLAELLPFAAEPGAPAPAAPPPDVFNLWRMAGLVALLPRQFGERAVFSLNELEVDSRYRLTVLKALTAPKPEPINEEATYVAWCLERLEQAEFERCLALRDWLDERLEAASVSALNGLTRLYELLNARVADEPLDVPQLELVVALAQRIAAWVNVQPYALLALDSLQRQPEGPAKIALEKQIFRLIQSLARPLDPALVDALFARVPQDLTGFQQLLQALPETLRASMFRTARERGYFIARRTPEETRPFFLWALTGVAPHVPEQQEELALCAVEAVWAVHPSYELSLERLLFACDALAPRVRWLVLQEVERRLCGTRESLVDFVQESLRRGTPSEGALLKIFVCSEFAVDLLLRTFPPSNAAPGYVQFIEALRRECPFDRGPELALYAELATLVRMVVVEAPAAPTQGGWEGERASAPSSVRRLLGFSPAENSGSTYRLQDPEIPAELEAHTCISTSALRSERLRPLVLRHLQSSRMRLEVDACLLVVSAYARALVDANCFKTLEDVLFLVKSQAVKVADWLQADRAELRGQRPVRPAAVFAKILNAAAEDQSLEQAIAVAIARVDEAWHGHQHQIWDVLAEQTEARALKRWRRIADARPQAPFR